MAERTGETLDLDVAPDRAGAGTRDAPFPVPAYDPTRDRERKRGQIALYLIALLFVICLVPYLLMLGEALCARLVSDPRCALHDPDVTERMTQLFLTPIVGLVGAVTGFYFGEKAN